MGTPMIKPKKVRHAIAPKITSNRPMVFLSGLKVKAATANSPSKISAKIIVPFMPAILTKEFLRSMAGFSTPPILASTATCGNDWS